MFRIRRNFKWHFLLRIHLCLSVGNTIPDVWSNNDDWLDISPHFKLLQRQKLWVNCCAAAKAFVSVWQISFKSKSNICSGISNLNKKYISVKSLAKSNLCAFVRYVCRERWWFNTILRQNIDSFSLLHTIQVHAYNL